MQANGIQFHKKIPLQKQALQVLIEWMKEIKRHCFEIDEGKGELISVVKRLTQLQGKVNHRCFRKNQLDLKSNLLF